ncbi:xylulokinase [Acrocarpospora macrocephala]|uniref:Xylulokinase n=1 Tax=Acrocarpospora macrocephala TaxID=150177 RepID=A0A5M3X5Y0_9ACTN|nr:FGGY family carbohydrate kinase [Acrocarpospora macrocephala]GES16524.1 xylulokinase [Acrocarpospora macrocephala]
MSYLLTVDQGSSGTKAAVFDTDGHLLRQAARRTVIDHPDVVAAEADPERWWLALVECVRDVLNGPIPAELIGAVAVCGFMHTLVPVGENGTVTGPALLWPDQRPMADGSCVERMRWWVAENPEAAAKTRWYLPVKDFLRYRLTGQIATDRYDAGGTGFTEPRSPRTGSHQAWRSPGSNQGLGSHQPSPANGHISPDARNASHEPHAWSSAVTAYAEISVQQLPPIREPLDLAGEITPKAATLTGLAAGTPVAVGTGDWMATLLGAAAVLPERACVYLGTAGAIGGFASPQTAVNLTEPLCFAATTATGSALTWLADLVGGDAPTLATAAEKVPPGARGVKFLPHLMGERGDAARPSARGSILGLTLAHDRSDLARAVLEGTAMWLRTIAATELDRRDPAELVAVGGGARSGAWLRILAAVLQRDLLVPETTEAGLLGTAMIAATAIDPSGDEGVAALMDRWVRTTRTVPAEPDLVRRYQPLYEEFQLAEVMARNNLEPHKSSRPVPGRGRPR